MIISCPSSFLPHLAFVPPSDAMDPVTIVGLVGVATALADLVVKIAQGLNDYRIRYKEASRTLIRLRNYCNVIQAAALKIQQVDHGHIGRLSDQGRSTSPLCERPLTGFVDLMSDLDDEVQQLLGKDPTTPGELSRKTRLKVVWKEDGMKEHLLEIHYMAGCASSTFGCNNVVSLRESMAWLSHGMVDIDRSHKQRVSSSLLRMGKKLRNSFLESKPCRILQEVIIASSKKR